jgi:cell wall-associated NlpC family hydrolase
VSWKTVFGARPVAWSAVITTAAVAVFAGPSFADPTPTTPPDSGSRPIPAGQPRLPGTRPSTTPQAPVAPVLGPLAQQIYAAEAEVQMLGEQVKGLQEELTAAHQRTVAAQFVWQTAADEVARLRAAADAAANEAYREATGLRPYGSFASDLRHLGILLPGPDAPVTGSEAAARELGWAEADERTKLVNYNAALAAELELTSRHGSLMTTFRQRETALVDLKRRNADQLARIEAERDAFEQSKAGDYGKEGFAVDGMVANPNALKAVQFALSQIGKPYEWGAEGPNSYDCSGLMWASYRPYRLLNRVAKDQYRQTSNALVPLNKLLPGDLLFFSSTGGDWTSVSHVAMYIGGGRMVHAASRGTDVKIQTVWWSRIYAATRVLPAVPAPSPSPSPTQTTPGPGQTTTNPPTSAPPSSTEPSSTEPTSAPPTGDPTAPQTGGPADPPPSTEPSEDPDPGASGSPTP